MVDLAPYLLDIFESSVVVAVAAILGEAFSYLVRRAARHAGARPPTLRSIRDVLRIVWIALAVLGVAGVFQLTSAFTTYTVATVGGLVVSLALQTTLGNMIAGFLLLRDRAIRLDDVIEYGGVKGRVIRVALRNTWVLTEKGQVAIIGNSALQGGPTINHTASDRFAKEFNT